MAQADETLDLIAVGRAGVDLYGEQVGGRLEDMRSFAKYVGGSPANTAVGAARLGLKAGLLTRVGADHMGRFIREELEREGVSTEGVREDAQRLTALVILGIRDRDTFPLIFYRENCADMALEAGDVDEALVARAKAVLINGTHLSQPGVAAASRLVAELAKAHGGKVVFDIDYRPVLWGLTGKDAGENRFVADAAVTRAMQEVLPLCDLVVGTEEEIHILGGDTDTMSALRAIRMGTQALIVCKLGAQGCVAFPGDIPNRLEQGVAGRGFPVEVFNVLGAGDGFMAGFLRGWLRDEPLERCCALANAVGAIVVSRHGCAPAMPTWAELEDFLAAPPAGGPLREDARLEHLHWATTRPHDHQELTILAVDHRSQFEELAVELGVNDDKIPAFKSLALRAVAELAKGDDRFGILVDGRYGMRALEAAADTPYWIGRPIELPKSRPLEFEGSADVAAELATWPVNHVVKCLALYHPDDEAGLKAGQERQLIRLFDACRKTRHELLLEIIASQHGPVDATTIARAMQRIYDVGVRPDWWKLEPAADAETWRNIERVVLDNDPHCRGVVLLGLSAPQEELLESFRAAAPVGVVKGFAVGRTIFNGVAQRWFSGQISDEQATAELAGNLGALVDAWRAAKAETGAG